MDANSGVGNQLPEDSPKIKIKTDLFKEAEANQIRRGVITDGGELDKSGSSNILCDIHSISEFRNS